VTVYILFKNHSMIYANCYYKYDKIRRISMMGA